MKIYMKVLFPILMALVGCRNPAGKSVDSLGIDESAKAALMKTRVSVSKDSTLFSIASEISRQLKEPFSLLIALPPDRQSAENLLKYYDTPLHIFFEGPFEVNMNRLVIGDRTGLEVLEILCESKIWVSELVDADGSLVLTPM